MPQLLSYPIADFQCNMANLVKVSSAVLVKPEYFGLLLINLRYEFSSEQWYLPSVIATKLPQPGNSIN